MCFPLSPIVVTPQPETSSPIAGSVLPLRRAEELLLGLTDVVSARIVATESGAVDTIHVLVSGELTPKQVVRNIESALMAHLGMRVDHRKISIATTVRRPTPAATEPPAVVMEEKRDEPPAPAETPPAPTGRFLYFEDVEIRGSRTKGVTCKVTLRRDGDHFVGEADGYESDRSRVELAARAALGAIALSEGAERPLALEGVKMLTAFDRELVMVGVVVRQGRGSALLTGCCEIRDSAETASVLAVLNATNRWVEGVR